MVLGLYRAIWVVIGWYDLGSGWYDHIYMIYTIYVALSIYKCCSSYTAWSSSCFRTCRECLLYIENYIFVYWTSNVSKRQYHYNITFSKRYDDIRSLTRYISGCSYIMPFPTLIMHVSNKRTFIIYILHFMFCYGISFFLIYYKYNKNIPYVLMFWQKSSYIIFLNHDRYL